MVTGKCKLWLATHSSENDNDYLVKIIKYSITVGPMCLQLSMLSKCKIYFSAVFLEKKKQNSFNFLTMEWMLNKH